MPRSGKPSGLRADVKAFNPKAKTFNPGRASAGVALQPAAPTRAASAGGALQPSAINAPPFVRGSTQGMPPATSSMPVFVPAPAAAGAFNPMLQRSVSAPMQNMGGPQSGAAFMMGGGGRPMAPTTAGAGVPFDWQAEYKSRNAIRLPLRRPVGSFFMSPSLAESLSHQNQLITSRLRPDDKDFYTLPISLFNDRYHSLWPLPAGFDGIRSEYITTCYKVTSTKDGCAYVLRCVNGTHSEEFATRALEPWVRLAREFGGAHPGVVAARNVFQSKDFRQGPCLCLVYDYFPGAIPLFFHYKMAGRGARGREGLPPESQREKEQVLWSFIVQIVTALSAVHARGLAAMGIDPVRVLVQDKRLRLNFCGTAEALGGVPRNRTLAQLQYEDLVAMCELIMSVALRRRVRGRKAATRAFEAMRMGYSKDLCGLLHHVLSGDALAEPPTVQTLAAHLSHRCLGELTRAYTHQDALEVELAKACRNGKLFGLIAKLGFVTERPEFKNNPKWAETGDRYLVKLLRDHIFHSVDETGAPEIDLGHVVGCLNKLDAASNEKVILTSRRQDTMIVASYKELNKCLTNALQELQDAANASAEVKAAPLSNVVPKSSMQLGMGGGVEGGMGPGMNLGMGAAPMGGGGPMGGGLPVGMMMGGGGMTMMSGPQGGMGMGGFPPGSKPYV